MHTGPTNRVHLPITPSVTSHTISRRLAMYIIHKIRTTSHTHPLLSCIRVVRHADPICHSCIPVNAREDPPKGKSKFLFPDVSVFSQIGIGMAMASMGVVSLLFSSESQVESSQPWAYHYLPPPPTCQHKNGPPTSFSLLFSLPAISMLSPALSLLC